MLFVQMNTEIGMHNMRGSRRLLVYDHVLSGISGEDSIRSTRNIISDKISIIVYSAV
jgi:hypothetical protein